ncbi:MAG: hypothetical protein ABIH72_04420 [archaeon]
MKKRGELEIETLAIIVIVLIFLGLAVAGVVLFKDKGINILDYIKDILGGR